MKKALIIANMIFASATVFGMENPARISQETSSQNQRLEEALLAENIDFKQIVQLIDEEADVNALMSNGHTPLTFAVDNSNFDLSSILIGLGADVNLKDNQGSTPLTLSLQKEWFNLSSQSENDNQEKITDMLLQSENIDLDLIGGEWGMSPLSLAMEIDSMMIDLLGSERSKLSMTKKLLQAGAKADGVAEKDNLDTHLMRAVMYRNEFMVRLLLDNRADVHSKNRYGDTVTSLAARNGYEDMLELLSVPTQGSIIQLLSAWKNQHSYSLSGVQSLMNELLENINEKNNNGYTMLMSALEGNQPQTAEWLINRGADVNLRNNAGRTALMFAARSGYLEVVQALLNKGARADLTDNEGHSAKWFAEENGHDDIVVILNSVN
ncbi:MAG: ankyrin repeat domain-containing protein [Bacteroidales bacterium]|nr:ankyrin repeat domain-containing protein [Bacteroidales bacterium]